ncbi:MAG TPA: WbqC family protein [Ignavibacteria bacterium]|nr:WbqC family protein [Ignavibacteria bacterium]HMR38813.1 WbqC family protein [Ignavibacteria bacterium]
MKKIIITQSNYIPWKGYFDSINMADEFVLYDDMQYTRRDWRNRNQIKTKDGLKWLSIPVEVKGKYFQKINETKVSEPDWGEKHWNTIVHNYSKAKYFNEYKKIFEELYLNSDEEYLSKINYNFIKAICEILGIRTEMKWSSEFKLLEEKTERLVDICKKEGATDYYSGPAAKAYMNEELFDKENIKVHYFDYSGYPEYRQLHGEFTHAVSILDLIFNEGPDTIKFMKSF